VKCPKCRYIGFDSGDRCRNCGYEFSLTIDLETLDLPIQTGDEPMGPMADLALGEFNPALPSSIEPERVRHMDRNTPQVAPRRAPRTPATPRPGGASAELPLFRGRDLPDDVPLITPPAVPRVPLSVRRSTPALPRGRTRDDTDEGVVELGPPEVEDPVMPGERFGEPEAAFARWAPPAQMAEDGVVPAGALPRLLAAGIDTLFLGTINLAVVYSTLWIARLGVEDVYLLPRIPLAAFLALLNGTYFVLFTVAGGQTIGKMAAAIRVVSLDPEGRGPARVPLGQAVVRAAAYIVSVLPMGLGYLPALIGDDRRAIHDRIADTRVIEA
jgi:uncharacterized RDD family membrane protein YckC